jgi:hypothetical protein
MPTARPDWNDVRAVEAEVLQEYYAGLDAEEAAELADVLAEEWRADLDPPSGWDALDALEEACRWRIH